MTQLDLDAIKLILNTKALDIESKTDIIIEIVSPCPVYPSYIPDPQPWYPSAPIVTYGSSK